LRLKDSLRFNYTVQFTLKRLKRKSKLRLKLICCRMFYVPLLYYPIIFARQAWRSSLKHSLQ